MDASSNTVGVGLIGIGGFGSVHVRSIVATQRAGLCRWLAAYDRDPARYEQKSAELAEHGVQTFSSLDQMLSDCRDSVQLVGIATGIDSHCQLSIRCMQAGYHVICEKPPAATIQDLDAMIAASRQTRRLCVIHFQGCWTNTFIELRRLICRGQLGQIRSVRYCGRFRRTDAYYSRNTWAGRLRLDNRWILDGTINNPFAHQVNAALHLASTNPQTPTTPRRVRAELYRCRDIEGEDTSCLAIETTEGTQIGCWFTLCSEEPQPGASLQVVGQRGIARSTGQGRVALRLDDGQELTIEPDGRDSRQAVYEDTCRFILTGQPPLRCPVQNTRPFVLAVNGAYESSRGTHRIPQQFIARQSCDDSVACRLRGIDRLIEDGLARGLAFSQLGADWAVPTNWFELSGYRRFDPDF